MDVAGQHEGAAAAPRSLPDLIDDLADRYPERAALEAPGGRAPLTIGELAEIPVAFLAVTSVGACAPLNGQTRPPRPYVAPRNELERAVADLWKEILKVEPISVDDRFLELGGDSILAGRITARLCALYSIELPMPILFGTPTVAGIAELIEQKTARRPDDAELEQYLSAIEDLTDAEAERLLAEEAD
jgi:acyl carrier protein